MTEELYRKAVQIIKKANRGSATLLQTKLNINSFKANSLIQRMEDEKIVSAPTGRNPRQLLI